MHALYSDKNDIINNTSSVTGNNNKPQTYIHNIQQCTVQSKLLHLATYSSQLFVHCSNLCAHNMSFIIVIIFIWYNVIFLFKEDPENCLSMYFDQKFLVQYDFQWYLLQYSDVE